MHKAKHAKSSRGILVLIGLVLCLAVGIQGTLAYLHTQTDPVVNTFTPSEVDCEIHEGFNGTQKTSITVENTGDTEAYIRVALVSYRVNEDGNVIGGAATVSPSLGNDWKYNNNDGYYYYKKPVAAGHYTGNLLANAITLQTYNDADGGKQVIEVHAEAIQSTPARAVREAWGDAAANAIGLSANE